MPTQEELMLGLDPKKYTKKAWNPYDFIKTVPRGAQIDLKPADVKTSSLYGGEVSPEIEEMYKSGVNPWEVATRDYSRPTDLDRVYTEALAANPGARDIIEEQYNEAKNATWGTVEEEDPVEPVPPALQVQLFKDWLAESLSKSKNKQLMQRILE